MNIAMVTNSCYPADPRVRREAEALAGDGYNVDVICIRQPGETFRYDLNGVRVYRVPLRHRRSGPLFYILEYTTFFLMAMVFLSILHLLRGYRIVHVHNMPNFIVFTTLFPGLLGSRIILDMHDPMPEIYQVHFGVAASDWKIRILKLEEKISCLYADHVITVDEPMREQLIEKSLDPDKVSVVMNFPDPDIFSKRKNAGGRSAGTTRRNGKLDLVYTGLVSQRNGLDIAIEAVRLLKGEFADLRLTIVGDGPHLPQLKRMVDENNLHEKVLFREPVMIDQVPSLVSKCDVGISAHRDNAFTKLMFSTKVSEYLALDLPVISARTYTMKYYFDDSEIFFFEPGNADDLASQIRLIRECPDEVESRKRAAREKMRVLNWLEEKRNSHVSSNDSQKRVV